MILKIALRNILRNSRRTAGTALTIAIGAAAMLVFGAFMLFSTYGLQTSTVRANGHIAVYRDGYFTFGAGNPAAWGIPDYERVVALIRKDPALAPMVEVATPVQAISGIIANEEGTASKTFFGTGFVPSDRDRMRAWNPYGTGSTTGTRSGLDDEDPSQGLVGMGLANMLGMCERLHLPDCPQAIKAPDEAAADSAAPEAEPAENFSFLEEAQAGETEFVEEKDPVAQLLGATVGGAPNVVQVSLRRAEYQGVKAVDDSYVGLHLKLAQQLVYGRQTPRATGIVLLLHATPDLDPARARLRSLFRENKLALEVRDFTELSPTYKQATGLYQAFFAFISLIIAIVVIFSVSNAVSMSVIERTNEIGTLRALGLRRGGVRRQFLIEGALIGILGATLGVVIAFAVAWFVNGAGFSWTPPGNAQPVPIRLYMSGEWRLPALVWAGLVLVAVIASVIPALRASRLQIVDALRYV